MKHREKLVEGFLDDFDLYVFPDEHIGDGVSSNLEWEPWIVSVIEEKCSNGDIAVDLGANIGTHTIPLSKSVGSNGKVFAFEPNPVVFSLLEKNLERNDIENVEAFNVGISSSRGTEKLKVRTDNFGAATTNEYIKDEISYDEIEISVYRLSDFVEFPDFIKMDVEGSEIDIIPTLNLDSIGSMVVEIHQEMVDRDEMDSVISLLEESGSVEWVHRQVVWE